MLGAQGGGYQDLWDPPRRGVELEWAGAQHGGAEEGKATALQSLQREPALLPPQS